MQSPRGRRTSALLQQRSSAAAATTTTRVGPRASRSRATPMGHWGSHTTRLASTTGAAAYAKASSCSPVRPASPASQSLFDRTSSSPLCGEWWFGVRFFHSHLCARPVLGPRGGGVHPLHAVESERPGRGHGVVRDAVKRDCWRRDWRVQQGRVQQRAQRTATRRQQGAYRPTGSAMHSSERPPHGRQPAARRSRWREPVSPPHPDPASPAKSPICPRLSFPLASSAHACDGRGRRKGCTVGAPGRH